MSQCFEPKNQKPKKSSLKTRKMKHSNDAMHVLRCRCFRLPRLSSVDGRETCARRVHAIARPFSDRKGSDDMGTLGVWLLTKEDLFLRIFFW